MNEALSYVIFAYISAIQIKQRYFAFSKSFSNGTYVLCHVFDFGLLTFGNRVLM